MGKHCNSLHLVRHTKFAEFVFMKPAVVLAFFLLTALSVSAQYSGRNRARRELSFYYEYGQAVYFDSENLAADDRALSRVLVNFRVAYDALTFQRPTVGGSVSSPFGAVLNMRADLLDERDVTVQRASWHDTLHVPTYYETNDKYRYTGGAMSFDVAPGTYTLVLTAEDGISRQIVREQRTKMHLRNFAVPLQCSMPLLLTAGDSTMVRPLNVGGNAEFGMPFSIYLDVISATESPSVRYTIMRLKNSDSAGIAQGTMVTSRNTLVAPRGGRCFFVQSPADGPRYGLRAQIASDSMDLGDYSMHIELITAHDTIRQTTPFHVVWSTMPLSLAETDYSIEAMRYILSDAQLDSIRDGNAATRKKNFDRYWTAHDPTPGTIFNERKAEYFHRVDDAYFTFRNPAHDDDDGMRTDRGKIYILFGKPTSIDRSLLPDGPAQETWTYTNNVRKKFTFVDADKNGAYHLTDVSELK